MGIHLSASISAPFLKRFLSSITSYFVMECYFFGLLATFSFFFLQQSNAAAAAPFLPCSAYPLHSRSRPRMRTTKSNGPNCANLGVLPARLLPHTPLTRESRLCWYLIRVGDMSGMKWVSRLKIYILRTIVQIYNINGRTVIWISTSSKRVIFFYLRL